MKKYLLLLSAMMLSITVAQAHPAHKIIDDGGSGSYKAEAVSDSTLGQFVIYRPADYSIAVKAQGPLPLFVFANGGCNDTSLPYERMLNDIASYGYLVIALGQMQDSINDRPVGKSPNGDMLRAIDWAEHVNADPTSTYYKGIDLDYVAFGGHSCGGAQVLANCADPRVKTCIMFNSGMGDMTMGEASTESLSDLHCPILYIIGGEGDVAYANALIDYERIDHVPVAFANHLRIGHGGTFHELYGGSFSRMARAWLGWQFKDRRRDIGIFLRNRLAGFPDFTMKAKNFPDANDPYRVEQIGVTTRDGKNINGYAYIPNGAPDRKPFVLMAHGYNSSYREPQAYAMTLAMRGVASYVFDFCGGGNDSSSDGETTDMTIYNERDNIEDIIEAVRQWEFVDTTRMALLGCSQGGLVAALTTSQHPEMFKSLVLVYPALMIPETAPGMLARYDAEDTDVLQVMNMRLGRGYYEAINGMNIYDSIPAYKGDVLIVYGDHDFVADGAARAHDIYIEHGDTARCIREKVVVPEGTHGFSRSDCHEQACGAITEFVLRSLMPKPDFGKFGNVAFDVNDPGAHDPVMARQGDTYYVFTTGVGIGMMSSKDLIHWREEAAPLNPLPMWATEYVPSYRGHTWAPDIVKRGDRWYLYYSCSTFSKNISVIGVATNTTLDPNDADYRWEDLGMVVRSQPGINDWNAIDPNVSFDGEGHPWLVFGSFWDGIQLVRLDEDMKTPIGEPVTIARRWSADKVAHGNESANSNAIEAPFITERDGWYYLFVSYDFCCQGLDSNYKTAVGRSHDISGPFVDRAGRQMTDCGGEILVGESDRYNGVGHCSVYEIDGEWYFLAHAYDKTKHGASKLYLHRLEWIDGWPEISE